MHSVAHCANGADYADESKVIARLLQRDEVGDDCFSQGHDFSYPASLDTFSSKHDSEVVRDSTHDCADCEERESKQKDGTSTEDI